MKRYGKEFMKWMLTASLIVGLTGCETFNQTDDSRYFEIPRAERVLQTLAEENYNGQDELTIHFVLFTESLEDAERVASELAEDGQMTMVEVRRFPPHRGVLVRGESTPMVVNRESLVTFQSRLNNAASPNGAFLLGWGTQIYMSPRQQVEMQDLVIVRIKGQLQLMNITLELMLQKVRIANINAANAAMFLAELKSLGYDVFGAKYEIQHPLLGGFYEADFEDWYFELTFLCELMHELQSEYLFPVPAPNDPDYDTWKRNVLEELAGIKDQISSIQALLQAAIDAYPPDVGGMPHPLTQHLRDLLARLERLKEAIDRARQEFTDTDDFQAVLNLLDELRAGKQDFIIDLSQAPGNAFTLFGISFYEWFHTFKLLDEALDRILEFEFRDPTDRAKTEADLNRLKQMINEAIAFKELMEKWELVSEP